NALLMVMSFNKFRSENMELRESIVKGTEKLIRPVTMTALAAILGLLPAAVSTRMGSESQRPLAIVVVGGLLMTRALTDLEPGLYVGGLERRAPPAARVGKGTLIANRKRTWPAVEDLPNACG